MPAIETEDSPFIKYFSYAFQGPTGLWYIENSLGTFDLPDPVAELNSRLYNASKDEDSPQRKQANKQSRKLNYVSNILVVDDPEAPENNGKVFLYRYGKKIFEKINASLRPEFATKKPVNPFDMLNGANFNLAVKRVNKFPNYDESAFDTISPVSEDIKELEKIYKAMYPLLPEIGSDKFKTYEQLKERLEKTLYPAGQKKSVEDSYREDAPPRRQEKSVDKFVEEEYSVGEEDEGLEYFQKLANSNDDEIPF